MRKPNPKNVEYKNQFNAEKYDRMNIMVPKGQKEAISSWAKNERGYDSTNKYISGLIQSDMGLSDDDWKNPKPINDDTHTIDGG